MEQVNPYIVAIISGGIGSALISGIFTIIQYYIRRRDGLYVVAQMLTRNEITKRCRNAILQGEISGDELEELLDAYDVYIKIIEPCMREKSKFLQSMIEQVSHLKIVDNRHFRTPKQ